MEVRKHKSLKDGKAKNYPESSTMSSYFLLSRMFTWVTQYIKKPVKQSFWPKMRHMERVWRDVVKTSYSLIRCSTNRLPIFPCLCYTLSEISSFLFYLLFYARYVGWPRNSQFHTPFAEFPSSFQLVLKEKELYLGDPYPEASWGSEWDFWLSLFGLWVNAFGNANQKPWKSMNGKQSM